MTIDVSNDAVKLLRSVLDDFSFVVHAFLKNRKQC